ncbi:tRNA(Ile)-lysidine synthase [Candidatus Vidania fulgoroideae]|nr:tRNA(Ile)-lysidine synthase [Candidatus Vidania fulgoroideae]
MLPFNIREKIISYIYKNIFKKKTAIAFSGGLDSSILLDICKKNKNLMVIHVNHNLNKDSKKWSEFCKTVARKKKLKFKSLEIFIKEEDVKKYGIEGAARIKRYISISNYMRKKKIRNLLTAHHLDDCIETYILKFFRGCGIRGLKSIEKKKKIFGITLFRPLIEISRLDLISLFKKPKKYIKDPSNSNKKIRRNMIRFILNKYVYNVFPNIKKVILRNIDNYKCEIKLLDILAKKDIKETGMFLIEIAKLSRDRIINIIVFLLNNKNIGIPSKKWILEVVKQIKKKKKSMVVKKKNVIIFIREGRLVIDENNSA